MCLITQAMDQCQGKPTERSAEEVLAEEERIRQELLDRRRRLELDKRYEEGLNREVKHRRLLLDELREKRRKKEEEELSKRSQEEVKKRQAQEADRLRRQERLNAFLSAHDFSAVNEKKRSGGLLFWRYTYPLHVATKAANAEDVELLLWGGADRMLKDSDKLSPLEVALRMNEADSHKSIIDRLLAG
eukprot:CAMPEP_0179093282 /NCGR_PEP_ID=MMETSP0796-20121207/42711_1 /TAXON_ID=73915 /ORGANISM="Pyrodinium bahamense, Strain pbaha01" /LENGTH=187 /DNA_ID=CAMNT_0020790911 /DNA_START=116 /DNA_END=679 /DNA_ORIENTATION=+